MVHFLPELITLNYCEGPYMTLGLPKSSHGLHQKLSSLNRDLYKTLNSASFPLLGGRGLCPQAWPSGSHLLRKQTSTKSPRRGAPLPSML